MNKIFIFNNDKPFHISMQCSCTLHCTTFGPKVVDFPARNTCKLIPNNFVGLYFPHFTTFRNQTLQFTNFNMLFLSVVMDFVLLA